MESEKLAVQMFGTFSLSYGGNRIDDNGDRSKKVWLLLAYLIYYRRRAISQEELINLLWNKEGGNPGGALKTTLHRVRTVLDRLSPSVGHELISYRGGSYSWNSEVELWLDIDEFERLCKESVTEEREEDRFEKLRQAVSIYNGDFLEKLSSEPWVVPILAYHHNLYVQAVMNLLPMLEARGCRGEAVVLCEEAVKLEPYHEELHQILIHNLIELGQQKRAATVYEDFSRVLLDDFGTIPTEETRNLYRQAMRIVNDRIIHLDLVRSQLQEPCPARGAMICEYDFFKVLYQAEARALVRSGNAVHIGLLTVTGESGDELPRRSLDRAMANLRDQIQTNLRKGDVASQCSVSQFIMMLPRANYENSCMVCERVIKAFNRQYPHSPARIDYAVQALEPN